MEDIDFDLEPDEHKYHLNGVEMPATTRVLALARKSMDSIPRQVLETARDRGKAVHRAIELYMKDDLDIRTLGREVKWRLDRFRRFMDLYKVEPVELPLASYMPTFHGGVFCEVPMVHPLWKFGVTPDIGIARVDGVLSVIEIKATSAHNAATALQMAAQQETINYFMARHGYLVEQRWGVRLTADENPEVRRYKDPSDWPAFLAFLNVHNWRKGNRID